jgi:hypothetical protein
MILLVALALLIGAVAAGLFVIRLAQRSFFD